MPRSLLSLAIGAGITLLTGCADDAPTAPAARVARALRGNRRHAGPEVRVLAVGRGIGPLARPAPVRPELVQLGRALAFDKILSGNRDISCMTCHLPGFAHRRWAQPVDRPGRDRPRARPRPPGRRVHPAQCAAALQSHALEPLFWDGG